MWSGKKEWFLLKENQQVSEHSQPAHKWQYFITYGQCIGSINIQTSKLNHIQNPPQKYEQRRLIVYLWRDTVAADNTNTNKPVTGDGEMRWDDAIVTHFQTVSACCGWRGHCHCCGPLVPALAALVTGLLVITAVLSAAVGAPVSTQSLVVQHFTALLAGNLSIASQFGMFVQKSTYKVSDVKI